MSYTHGSVDIEQAIEASTGCHSQISPQCTSSNAHTSTTPPAFSETRQVNS